jgi:hypothetical protein
VKGLGLRVKVLGFRVWGGSDKRRHGIRHTRRSRLRVWCLGFGEGATKGGMGYDTPGGAG